MRYLVLGAGALGGYFGGMLLKGGADVTFLVRPARAAQLRRDGLVVKTQDGGELRIQAKTIQQGQVDGPYDVVLLCCKAYDLDGAMAAIAPAMGEQSVILPLLNGVRHIDALTERFGPGRVRSTTRASTRRTCSRSSVTRACSGSSHPRKTVVRGPASSG